MNFLLHLFRMGYDTQTIADNIGVDECEVYNLLSALRGEEREAARNADPERLERLRAYNRVYQANRRAANRKIREAMS